MCVCFRVHRASLKIYGSLYVEILTMIWTSSRSCLLSHENKTIIPLLEESRGGRTLSRLLNSINLWTAPICLFNVLCDQIHRYYAYIYAATNYSYANPIGRIASLIKQLTITDGVMH